MMRAAWAVLWSHWRRAPLQLFALIAGLAMATALFSGVQAINSEARAAYDRASAQLRAGGFGQIVAMPDTEITVADYVALRRAGWAVAPVLEGTLSLPRGDVAILGIDPLNPPQTLGEAAPGGDIDFLAVIAGDVGFAPPSIADHWSEQGGLPRVEPVLDAPPNTIVMDIGRAEQLLAQPNRLSRLLLVSAPSKVAALGEIAPHLRFSPAGQDTDPAELTESFHLNLSAFGVLSFVVGLFIVQGVVQLAFAQRKSTLQTLRLLGLPLWRLVMLIALEQVLLGLIAAGLGILGGYVLAAALLPDISASLSGLYGADIPSALTFRAEWWGLAIGLGVFGSLMASFGAYWALPRMRVIGGQAAGPMRQAAKRAGGMAGVALLLAGAALGLAVFGRGLVSAFAFLACLLASAALALPYLLDALARFGQYRARGAIASWFWADMRLQISALSLVLMALLLALATNIGVSTMVSSFRLSFIAFLDQRLTADLYIEVAAPEQAERIAALQGEAVSSAHPVQRVEQVFGGQPSDVYAMRPGPEMKQAWTFLDARADIWEALERGKGVLISEQLSRSLALELGDMLPLQDGVIAPVIGVFPDYGNTKGQLRIGGALFERLYPNTPIIGFGLYTDRPEAVRAMLIDGAEISSEQISDQAEVKALSLQIFERTFAVTAALSVLTLGVAGFAMLMALITMADMRVPQLAPLWAMGVERRGLVGWELARLIALAALTALIALPLGVLQAWVLLRMINVEAFGWQLPLFVFPLQYGVLIALALLTAILAALWPMWGLMRKSPADLIKVFVHAS